MTSWFTCQYPSPFWIFFSKVTSIHLYDNIYINISYTYYLMLKLLYFNLFTHFIFRPSPVGRFMWIHLLWHWLNIDKCTYVVAAVAFFYMHTNDFETVYSHQWRYLYYHLKWDSSVAVYIEKAHLPKTLLTIVKTLHFLLIFSFAICFCKVTLFIFLWRSGS